jgi:hypothetical protein
MICLKKICYICKKKDMTREFTKEFMTSNRGCYSREKMLNVKCVKENNITLENLFNDLPIKDFCWFFVRKCELTTEQNQRFALHCAKQVLPIFEKAYPKDKRVRECIEATELFLDGKISVEQLEIKRADDDDAAYVDAAAADAADAAYAAYVNAIAYVNVTDAAAAYADDDAAAADAADAAAYADDDAAAAYAAAYVNAADASDAAYAAYAADVNAADAAYVNAFKKSVWGYVLTIK